MKNNVFFTSYNTRNKLYVSSLNLKTDLTDIYLNEILSDFFKYIQTIKKDENYISIITNVCTIEDDVYSLGNKTVIDLNNNENILAYIESVIYKFNYHFHTSNQYNPKLIDRIQFSHNYTSLNSYTNYTRKINRHKSLLLDNQISKGIVDKYNLPFNILYHSWGNIYYISSSKYKITNIYFNKDIESILVTSIGSFHSLSSLVIIFKDNKTLTLTDKMQEDGYIKRLYSNSIGKPDLWYTFNPVLSEADLFVNYNKLPKLYRKDKEGNDDLNKRSHIIKKSLNYDDIEEKVCNLQNKFPGSNIPDFKVPELKAITLDCEAYLTSVEDKTEMFNLLSICFFDGKKSFKFYKTDFNSIKEMLDCCFDKIFVKQYADYNIYMHNGAKFDLVFLLNYLLNREDIKTGEDVIYKDGKFIQITISKEFKILESGKERIVKSKFIIKDSLLILPNSLSKLGKSFNVEIQKDFFPHTFANENNLNYIGPVPAYHLFENQISLSEYNEYCENFTNDWDLKTINLDYCAKDCISLYQIIYKFKTLIDIKFKIDIQQCPTLTSIAFKIFKGNYYNPDHDPIPLLTREIFEDLHNAYHGGHVDMYIPEGPKENGTLDEILKKYNSLEDKSVGNIIKNFKIINHYDVNSLYPSEMIANKYPTDMVCEFIGDIRNNTDTKNLYDEFVGVYKVHMYGADIKHPIIPVKINGNSIYGCGEWIGWYYSEELKNAEKYGYTFKILGGYVFESKNIFNNYIMDLYEIKQNTPKTDAMYLISKLLMNSLYGRFGLDTFLPSAYFLTDDEFKTQIESKKIDPIEVITKDFENHVLVITPNKCKEYSNIDGNVSIALAITANARIRMCELENNPLYSILYTDTDSYFMLESLPENMVDPKKLGCWSLENQYIYSVFLGAKSYACLDVHGNAYSKIKGYSSAISIEEFSKLLDENEVKSLNQKKWRTFIGKSKILVKSTTYELLATSNKRNLVFEKGRLSATTNKIIKIVDSKNICEA